MRGAGAAALPLEAQASGPSRAFSYALRADWAVRAFSYAPASNQRGPGRAEDEGASAQGRREREGGRVGGRGVGWEGGG